MERVVTPGTVNLKQGKDSVKLHETGRRDGSGGTAAVHALAGALAGALVSLSLHPVDTIKTIVQANYVPPSGGSISGRTLVSSPQPLLPLVANILSQKGVAGLYKGVMASLVTSAPISGIYTTAYEGVKGALLPRMPQGMRVLAHCVAGACASIATSTVFTPSEVVKQRLQLGRSAYGGSLKTFLGILRYEGVFELYRGLDAVLCRNIPQSVVKFVAYEWLRHQALQASSSHTSKLHPVVQLAIGGVAGSTAAFVTTPFDVVKTRMQTQVVAGTTAFPVYTSVLDAIIRIASTEGILALYRGLVPRLVIYVSQGAIFFCAYEALKSAMTRAEITIQSSRRHGQSSLSPGAVATAEL